jgi:hypothetical protein
MSRLLTRVLLRLRSLFRNRTIERELEEELQYHLDREVAEHMANAVDPQEARYAALRALGPITQSKEECRDVQRVNWMEDLRQDLRYAARTLRKSPAFSIVAVLVLAVGIGANTAMFSVAYGILWRPLPYPDAERLAAIYMSYAARDFALGTLCIRDYLTWQQHNRAFENPALFRTLRIDVGGNGKVPEQVQGASVTAGFFSTLRVDPLIGRTFTTGEDRPGTASLAVLSEGIWRRRFSSSTEVLGQTILLNGAPHTVIGVMPRVFQLPRSVTEVWTNQLVHPPTRYGPWFYRGVARLKPGVTFEQAQAEMNNIALIMVQQNPRTSACGCPC